MRADIEGRFLSAVDQIPALAERVRAGRREERFEGTTDVPNFLRTPCGPGWALVGDAGGHKDPFLALGICDGSGTPSSWSTRWTTGCRGAAASTRR